MTGRHHDDWLDQGVFYQLYPRSWADSDGDGIGDLRGIVSRLDYLHWLGVDGVWLNPVMPSPNADWGYDVADYCAVDPAFGSLGDVDDLVREAHPRGIRVIFDLVPNHTSVLHPWFQDSRSSREATHRDWYVWADPSLQGGPPNNWKAALGGGSAWSWDEATGQYYLHSFLPEQADLNWWNEAVRSAFDDILRFWLDRGIDGFRIDVVHALIHDRELRGDPPALPEDYPEATRLGQRQIFSQNRPEVHDILRRWHALVARYTPRRVLIGETYLFDLAEVARYFGDDSDELDLAFNFPFIFSAFTAPDLAKVVATTEQLLPVQAWTTWTASNHDAGRFATRWCAGDVQCAKCVLTLLLTLRGTPFLYYGDEIAMTDVDVPRERLLDPAGVREWPRPGRDRCRTPMQWSASPGAGFTTAEADPWLPLGDHAARNVERERDDEDSPLTLTRDLIGLRRRSRDLRLGRYERVALDGAVWAWRRGEGTLVALNLAGETGRLPGTALGGRRWRVAAGTDPARRGSVLSGDLALAPWEAVVMEALP